MSYNHNGAFFSVHPMSIPNGVLVALGQLWGPAKGVFIICYLDGFRWWSLKRRVWEHDVCWGQLSFNNFNRFIVFCLVPTGVSDLLQVCVNWRLFWAIWWGKTSLVSRMNIIGVEISSNVFFFFLFFSFFGWSFGWQQQKIIINKIK